MPTTSYTDTTFSVAAIGNRTDSAGTAVTDYTAEEARFVSEILTAGYIKPSTAFKVTAQSSPNMTVKVGSGAAKADFYVVAGTVGGQGNYVVRLDVTAITVTVPAADASQNRTDEVYLVVGDDTYDASARSLPRIGYRKGDLAGGAPGPDSGWKAYALLGSFPVAALASSITNAVITDGRTAASLLSSLAGGTPILANLIDAKGDLIAGSAADTAVRVAAGTDGRVLEADAASTGGVRWSPVFAPAPVALTDGATPALDASAGTHFRLTAGGDRTIAVPSNPKDGQAITIEHLASGAARTLALNTGTGGFAFGGTIAGLTATDSGKRDFIRAIYVSAMTKWLVVGYSKGF